MAAVQIPNVAWPGCKSNHLGPYKDGNGNLWVVGIYSNLRACKSSDGGASWDTNYATSFTPAGAIADSMFDVANGVIYVLIATTSSVLQIWSFTIATTTWAEVYSSGTRPTVYVDAMNILTAFLTRRSTGEFVVVYQGPRHSLMGNPYRTVYYARCSAAGVWSNGVELSPAVKLNNYDCKGAALGASNRIHALYIDSSSGYVHRSLSSSNALDTQYSLYGSLYIGAGAEIIYDPTLGKLVAAMQSATSRALSGATPNWSLDSGAFGTNEASDTAPAPVLVYEPTSKKLYVFYRDANSDDLYVNSTDSTTWTTANAVQQDASTELGVSVVLVNDGGPVIASLDRGAVTTADIGWSTDGWRYSQAFTFITDTTLTSISLNLARSGSPTDTLLIQLCEDSSGSPGTVFATIGEFVAADLPAELDLWMTIPDLDIALIANTQYHLKLMRSGSNSDTNYYRLATSSGLAAGFGNLKRSWGGAWSIVTATYGQMVLTPKATAINIVYDDNGTVYFDKIVLEAPPEPIPPVTANEEFFSFL